MSELSEKIKITKANRDQWLLTDEEIEQYELESHQKLDVELYLKLSNQTVEFWEKDYLIFKQHEKTIKVLLSLIREEVEKVKGESPEPGWIPHEDWYKACDRILELLEGK